MFNFVVFVIGLSVGLLFGVLIGYSRKKYGSDGFRPLGLKRTAVSFADRLYDEKFQYPPYLTPGKTYNLPMSSERNVKAFGNILSG